MNKLIALCTSFSCTSENTRFNQSKYSIKEVSKSTINCPDCNSILLWKNKGQNARVKDAVHLKNKKNPRVYFL